METKLNINTEDNLKYFITQMSICFIITSLKNYIGLGITSSSIVKNFRESSVYLCKVLNNYKYDFEKLIMSFEILTTESVC